MHFFHYNPYSIVNEPAIAKIGAAARKPLFRGCTANPCGPSSCGVIETRRLPEAGAWWLPFPARHQDNRPGTPPFVGGADRDRTDDLLNANQALSQLSYSPISKDESGKMKDEARYLHLSSLIFHL